MPATNVFRGGSSRLAFAPDGTVWVMNGAGLVHYDATGAMLGSVAIPDYDQFGAEGMAVTADGSVWVASYQMVQRFDGRWTTVRDPNAATMGASSLSAADDGSVWAAIGSDGSCCSNVARF